MAVATKYGMEFFRILKKNFSFVEQPNKIFNKSNVKGVSLWCHG